MRKMNIVNKNKEMQSIAIELHMPVCVSVWNSGYLLYLGQSRIFEFHFILQLNSILVIPSNQNEKIGHWTANFSFGKKLNKKLTP